MKLIEQGMHVTSPYYGDGYVVRTLSTPTTKFSLDIIAIRLIPSKEILLCWYPYAINRLIFFDERFDRENMCGYNTDLASLIIEYRPSCQYSQVQFQWYEHGEIEEIAKQKSEEEAAKKRYEEEFAQKVETARKQRKKWDEERQDPLFIAHRVEIEKKNRLEHDKLIEAQIALYKFYEDNKPKSAVHTSSPDGSKSSDDNEWNLWATSFDQND